MPRAWRPLTLIQHEQRSQGHLDAAKGLHATPDEWAAVAYFYSSYHLVKAAFLADPIFDDPSRLARIPGAPSMDDRYAYRHKGYLEGPKRTKVWGVNDLVAALYKSSSNLYHELHTASCDVRYEQGLKMSLENLAMAQSTIETAYRASKLVAR